MITKFKIYENSWEGNNVIDVTNFINAKLAQNLPDIRDNVKEGDTVFYISFQGAFITYKIILQDLGEKFAKTTAVDYYDEKAENGNNLEDIIKQCRLGGDDGSMVYTLAGAYFVFSYEDYIKLDPNFELKIITNKYNL